jgi:hypothetical protein
MEFLDIVHHLGIYLSIGSSGVDFLPEDAGRVQSLKRCFKCKQSNRWCPERCHWMWESINSCNKYYCSVEENLCLFSRLRYMRNRKFTIRWLQNVMAVKMYDDVKCHFRKCSQATWTDIVTVPTAIFVLCRNISKGAAVTSLGYVALDAYLTYFRDICGLVFCHRAESLVTNIAICFQG